MSKTAKWLIGIFVVLGLFFFVIVMMFASLFSEEETEMVARGNGGTVALVELNTEIVSSQGIVQQLKKYRENTAVRAIVLRIESPGGGVSPSQEIYQEVKKTRQYGKPVVVSMGSVAASGGYYIAVGATRIVANPGSVTGSIGVISTFMHVDQLLNKIGVRSTTVKSGALKDAGSPYRPATEQDKKYFQEMIDDIYDQFVTTVATERKMEKDVVKKYADGRVFTGRRAYELKLIDTLGTYQDAIRIAADLGGIDGAPRVIKERKRERFTDKFFSSVRSALTEVTQEALRQPIVQYRYQLPQ